jgi:hypothetical protein
MPRFRIGTDDFKELRDDNGYFVDKSLLIKEVIEADDVTLIPRPRRFGKTLNMTMLRYFFEKAEENRADLFNGLAISECADAMKHQGLYPLIYLTLKDVKGKNWHEARSKISDKVADMVLRAKVDVECLPEKDQLDFGALINRTADATQLQASMSKLISVLHRQHDKGVVVLIDEYDSPVIEAWKNGYYEDMIYFIRNWLGSGLKHEEGPALFRAVLTGILRVAKESIFSGLNNPVVANMLRCGPFADKFGFTATEVTQLLNDFDVVELSEPIREWYNGYNFGGNTIYNPWSVVKSVNEWPNPLGPQWLNTGSNSLIHYELERGDLLVKRDLEKLLAGEELRYPIQDSTTFDALGKNPETIWSFLFFSGYLTASDPAEDPFTGLLTYRLAIPNKEVRLAYREFVMRWHEHLGFTGTKQLLQALINEQYEEVENCLADLVRHLFSYHDTAHYPEAVYHAFVLGLLANLRQTYEIRSNPESGYGRADIILRPKTSQYPLAFVIEFKSISDKEDSEVAAIEAVEQINRKGYTAQLEEAGIQPQMIRKLAIIVNGKHVTVLSDSVV